MASKVLSLGQCAADQFALTGVAQGALSGFGKASLQDARTLARLRAVLTLGGTP